MKQGSSIFIKYCFTAILSILSVSCGQDKEVKKAPTSEAELGFIVQGANLEQVESAGVKYRIINKKHKLFEVYDSEEKVRKHFPNSDIEKNNFRQKKFKLSQDEILDRDVAEIQNFIRDCKVNDLSIYIRNTDEVTARDKISSIYTLEEGTEFSLSATQLDGSFASEPKFLWAIAKGGWSNYDKYVFEGKDLKVKLNGLGVNKINVYMKDQNKNCGVATTQVLVFSNKAYAEQAPETLNILDPAFLDQLTGANVVSREDNINKVKVAVIDSGVNYNHYELYESISLNDLEIPGNGYDDDGNGYIDDYTGYDFYGGDPYPMDNGGHGTHVSGLIAGKSTGVTANAKIIPIKVGSTIGYDSASLAGAILYAVDAGAKVINLSLGSPVYPSRAELNAYQYTISNDVLVVVAAGNGDPYFGIGFSLDRQPDYPAMLDMPNKIVVAASSQASKPLTLYSNFGSKVDIVAPGGDNRAPLFSATIANDLGYNYVHMSGTSMAAPVVAGVAAELYSRAGNVSSALIINILKSSGDTDERLKGKIPSKKHLNAESAYQLVQELKNKGRL